MNKSSSKTRELETLSEKARDGELIFRTIGQILEKKPSSKGNLVGDCHVMKGAVTLIGGEPGCGKSLAALNLAIAGALKSDRNRKDVDWMGLKVNREFTTMVIQFENGAIRLYSEASQYPKFDYGERVFISNPPTFGERFGEGTFAKKVKDAKKLINPDVVVIDPWTSISDGDNREAVVRVIGEIRRVFGCDEDSPALVIVSHTAKPRGRNAKGVAMLHDIAGSFALAAHARVVFILERASSDPESDLVKSTCAKNNNGILGAVKTWHRKPGVFLPADEKVIVAAMPPAVAKPDKAHKAKERSKRAQKFLLETLSNSPGETKSRQELVKAVDEKGFGKKDFTGGIILSLEASKKVTRFRNGKAEMVKLLKEEEEAPETETTGGKN
ncbi:AAA family ATPase [Pelagicoccus sp. SDUM812002]|uniref:AAA family ATPase n=1 Tax=Pelagicoccus sp. SDUM812002 TaxID=3041266 RepID=UPI00280E4170|nr:AAA family ATPase [Pelagicoccus sp. SDUM812002]MDQ8184092.1 AAA family ATPase [Pelagicoccus sp. SDUM812002]